MPDPIALVLAAEPDPIAYLIVLSLVIESDPISLGLVAS